METFLNLNDVFSNQYFLVGGVLFFYLVYRILHSLVSDNDYMRTRYRSRGHTWRSIQCNKSVPYNIYVSTFYINGTPKMACEDRFEVHGGF